MAILKVKGISILAIVLAIHILCCAELLCGNICSIKAVAAVGHDTKLFRAEDAVYDKLPACCKYERIAQLEIKEKKE